MAPVTEMARCALPRGRKKAADTGSLLTHFIFFRFRSIIYEAKGGELYNSRVERLLAGYLIDTLPLEFLPSPACVHSIVSWMYISSMTWDILWLASVERPPPSVLGMLPSGGQVRILLVCHHLVAKWEYYSLYIWSCSLVAMWGYYSLLLYVLLFS